MKSDVFLSEGFTAEGEVRLPDAQIGGSLDCTGGTFKSPPQPGLDQSGTALFADRIDVTASVLLRPGFTAEGEVRLLGAQIGGDLECTGGAFKKLVAQTATVKGNFFWSEIRNPEGEQQETPGAASATEQARAGFAGQLDLTNASVGALADDEASWPDPKHGGTLLLDGFIYQRISAGPTDARSRLRWLGLQDDLAPQPYRQLAKALRETGDDRGARRVLYELEQRRRAREDQSLPSKAWGGLLRWTIGHGYYPQWAFWWLLAVILLGAQLFWMGYNRRAMTPTEKDAYSAFHAGGYPPPYYESFHALIYSLENSFPLVKLGQTDKWSPDPQDRPCPGTEWWGYRLRCCLASWACWLRWFHWFQICAGWVLTTLFVAGVTGIVRRE